MKLLHAALLMTVALFFAGCEPAARQPAPGVGNGNDVAPPARTEPRDTVTEPGQPERAPGTQPQQQQQQPGAPGAQQGAPGTGTTP